MAAIDQVEIPEQQEEESLQTVSAKFIERSTLHGHNQAITALQVNAENDLLVTASRDRTALVWRLPKQHENWATELTRLSGHNHFVSGVSFSSDSSHLLTSSWDKTLRLWDLANRTTKKLFLDHKRDVLDVTFSPCNRRIISVSRDKTVKLWNILGDCRYTLEGTAWATSVSCAPMENESAPVVIAVGFWDGSVKVWSITEKVDLLYTLDAHNGRCHSVAFTPDGQWLITGGSDRKVILWNATTGNKMLNFTAPHVVNSIAACPTRAWICAATYEGIAVWDITEKQQIDLVQPKYKPLGKREAGRTPDCTSLAWADDGSVLYAGYNDGNVKVWEVRSSE